MALRRPPTTFSDSIDAADLAANSVTSSELADNAVDAAAIAANAVTTVKILDDNITAGKIATGAVVADGIGAGAVVAAGIGTGAVVEAKLGASAVTSAKLATSLSAIIVPTWESKSADFTAAAGKGYFCDTSSNTITVTLPSPTINDTIRFLDATGTFDSYNLTVLYGSSKIQGASANLTVATERAGFALVYYNSTQGWLLEDK